MNKSESKYFNTAIRMDKALLSLLEEKDFQYITIKEICERAEVNRSTFYLHYETIGELLSEAMEYVMSRFQEKFNTFETIKSEDIETMPTEKLILITPEYLIPYLEFVKDNSRIFKVAALQPEVVSTGTIFNLFYTKIFYPIMKRFGIEEYEIKYKLAFYLNGIYAVINEWIRNNCKEDVDTMAKLIVRCIFADEDIKKADKQHCDEYKIITKN